MKRYMNDAAGMFAVPDGEWIRYEDHVESMKRIAGYGGQQEPICPACKGSGQIATGCDEFSESICKTCGGTGFAAPSASAQPAEPVAWKLVPVEPTQEMWDAVNKLDDEMSAGSYDGKGCSIEQAWNCMLASAPSASAQQAPSDPVGYAETGSMTSGFTMAVFDADTVPSGTPLYAAPAPSASPEPRKLLSDDRILRIAEMIFGLHSADISDHIWTTFARAIERETGRIPSVSITSSDLWTEVCNILPDGEFNPDKHVYLTQQQLAACAERVMERQAEPSASPAALTDEQIRDIALKYCRFVFPGVYSIKEFDCEEDFLNCARALLSASPAALTDDMVNKVLRNYFDVDRAKSDNIAHDLRLEMAAASPADQVEDTPDMFWNHDDPERCQDSIHNVVVEAYENGCNVGDIVEVQQAIRLHNIKVRIVEDSEDSEEISYELIEDAAMSASKEGA